MRSHVAFDVCLLKVMCPLWYVPAPVKGSLRAEVAPVGVTWLRVGCGVAGHRQQLQKLEFPLLCPVPLLIDPSSLELCMIGSVSTSKHFMIWKPHNPSASWEFVISFQWPQPRDHLGVLFMFPGNTPQAQSQEQCRFAAAKTTPRTISLSWPGQDYLFPVSTQGGSLQGLPP